MRKTKLYQSCHASRPRSCRRSHRRRGITSACAEQTRQESSGVGITSACAEQTHEFINDSTAKWDHLRVCGADGGGMLGCLYGQGSPPRVRSRLLLAFDDLGDVGITSACAEQTRTPRPRTCPAGDYLRVCGADEVGVGAAFAFAGLPPRVRSRPAACRSSVCRPGITSACAEQTGRWSDRRRIPGDYLRVCGADDGYLYDPSTESGLPPRVRSRRTCLVTSSSSARITSACAEQTTGSHSPSPAMRDYLRVCGADCNMHVGHDLIWGLPPRVRSRQRQPWSLPFSIGITSACAEQTSTWDAHPATA